MIGKAVTRGLIHKEEVNEMLHSVLFRGLRTSLKALSGHKIDAIQDFNTLRIADVVCCLGLSCHLGLYVSVFGFLLCEFVFCVYEFVFCVYEFVFCQVINLMSYRNLIHSGLHYGK
jgi:hypothetical protein